MLHKALCVLAPALVVACIDDPTFQAAGPPDTLADGTGAADSAAEAEPDAAGQDAAPDADDAGDAPVVQDDADASGPDAGHDVEIIEGAVESWFLVDRRVDASGEESTAWGGLRWDLSSGALLDAASISWSTSGLLALTPGGLSFGEEGNHLTLSSGGNGVRSGVISEDREVLALSTAAAHSQTLGVRFGALPDDLAALAGTWHVHIVARLEGGTYSTASDTVQLLASNGQLTVSNPDGEGPLLWGSLDGGQGPVDMVASTLSAPASTLVVNDGASDWAVGVLGTGQRVMLFGLVAPGGAPASGVMVLVRATEALSGDALLDPWWYGHLHHSGSSFITTRGIVELGSGGQLGDSSCFDPFRAPDDDQPADVLVSEGNGYTVDADGRFAMEYQLNEGMPVWSFAGPILTDTTGAPTAIFTHYSTAVGGLPGGGTLKVFVRKPGWPGGCSTLE